MKGNKDIVIMWINMIGVILFVLFIPSLAFAEETGKQKSTEKTNEQDSSYYDPEPPEYPIPDIEKPKPDPEPNPEPKPPTPPKEEENKDEDNQAKPEKEEDKKDKEDEKSKDKETLTKPEESIPNRPNNPSRPNNNPAPKKEHSTVQPNQTQQLNEENHKDQSLEQEIEHVEDDATSEEKEEEEPEAKSLKEYSVKELKKMLKNEEIIAEVSGKKHYLIDQNTKEKIRITKKKAIKLGIIEEEVEIEEVEIDKEEEIIEAVEVAVLSKKSNLPLYIITGGAFIIILGSAMYLLQMRRDNK